MIFKKLECFNSLEDMPVWHWFQIQKTNDLKYMLVKTRKVSEREVKPLELALKKLSNEYIDTFGISDEYRQILELNRDIKVLEIDFILTKDRSKLTMIELKKAELKAVVNGGSKMSVEKIKMQVDKYMHYDVDLKKVSVKQFYTYLEGIKEEYQQKQANER
jgi:hypothetical protein